MLKNCVFSVLFAIPIGLFVGDAIRPQEVVAAQAKTGCGCAVWPATLTVNGAGFSQKQGCSCVILNQNITMNKAASQNPVCAAWQGTVNDGCSYIVQATITYQQLPDNYIVQMRLVINNLPYAYWQDTFASCPSFPMTLPLTITSPVNPCNVPKSLTVN